jgi:hypothetical protein
LASSFNAVADVSFSSGLGDASEVFLRFKLKRGT